MPYPLKLRYKEGICFSLAIRYIGVLYIDDQRLSDPYIRLLYRSPGGHKLLSLPSILIRLSQF